jgi:tetratricopeptide (TPR) repeat protein
MKNILLFFILFILIYTKDYASPQKNPDFIHDSIELVQYLDSVRAFFQSDHEKANQIAHVALTKFDATHYVIGKISLLQFLAEIHYYYKDNYDSSIIYLERMKYLCDSIKLPRGTAWYYLNLGNVYYYQDISFEGDSLEKAMESYVRAKEEAEKIGDTIIIADALTGIADILMQRKDFENSLTTLYQALALAYTTGELRMQFLLYDDIANIFKLTGQYDSSNFYYQKTMVIAETLGNRFGILVTKLNLLYVSYKIDPKIDVLPELKTILKESRENKFMRLYIDTGYTICLILKDKNKFEEAFLLFQQITATRDSIYGGDMVRKVAEYESAYKLMKSKLKNKHLLSQNKIKSLKLRNRLIVIILIIFILLQTIIILAITYRKYEIIRNKLLTIKEQERKIFEQEKELIKKEKEAVEQKLRYKEREQTMKAMKIFHHNQLVQKVVQDLNALKLYISRNGSKQNSINRLQNMINKISYSNINSVWKEFETIFIESNPGYLEKLHQKYPNLTSNETKLCIFLYLNMRTKDISSITQQSIKSVNVARTRLRKKLHLENTNKNLSNFLRQIK